MPRYTSWATDRVNPAVRVVGLLGAWSLLTAGQWMFTVAFAVAAYERAGAGGVGAVTVARLAPAILAAPAAGVLIDRYDRGRVAVISAGSLTASLAAASMIVGAGWSINWLAGITVAVSALNTPLRPALQAVLPALARTPAELIRATAAWGAADNAGFLVGAGAGGLALALTRPGVVVAISAACCGVAATTLLMLLPAARAPEPESDAAHDSGSPFAGLRAVLDTPMLRVPFMLFVGLLLLEGSTDVQLVALAIDRLGLGSGGPGLLYVAWGAGGLLGSGALLVIVRRLGYGRALLIGAIGFGALLAVSGLGGVALALSAMVPVGLCYALVEEAVMGLVPRLVDDAVIGRVYGLSELLYAGAGALGALAAPALMHAVGVGGSLAAVGLGFGACAGCAWRRCARLDRGQQRADRVRELLHGVPFLAPLPLPQLERLARSARPLTVRAGMAVVRAGDVGEEFFVIDEGEVEITEFGRRQGSGEGFGEIALLRDIARTASVVATTDTALWAVSRSSFLAAVGASEQSRSAADATVTEHLGRPRPDRRRGQADRRP